MRTRAIQSRIELTALEACCVHTSDVQDCHWPKKKTKTKKSDKIRLYWGVWLHLK